MTSDVLVDCEGTFATLREAFPEIHFDAVWWLPVNVTLLRSDDATVLVDTGVAPEDVDVVVHTHLRASSRFSATSPRTSLHGIGRFERAGKGFRWAVE